MTTPWEQIAWDYLRFIRNCSFINYNVQIGNKNDNISQWEIDVIGINFEERKIFVSEVAVHLQTGLRYTSKKGGKTINASAEKFKEKILKNQSYIKNYFSNMEATYQIWSPIIRLETLKELQQMIEVLSSENNIKIELISWEKYLKYINELKEYAWKQGRQFDSPIMRAYQIEQALL